MEINLPFNGSSKSAKMTKEHQHKMSWPDMDTDHPDHKLFFNSGKRLLQKMAFGIVPSFIQKGLRPGAPKLQRIHPTAYLDGLRGVASFIVFMGHYTEENIGWYTEPYGLYEDGAASSPLQLPFLRVIYSARPMVHIFFIISGYVLAYKPLKQIHSQQYTALTNTLSSSVFRRAVRLFVPSFVTLFIMAITMYFGFSDHRYSDMLFTDLPSQLRDVMDTCWTLLGASWAIDDTSFPQPVYNPALWTIPVEFAQSLLLFITILGLSRCISNIRISLLTIIITFCFYNGQIYTVEFLGGMVIAELTLIQDRSLITPSSSPVITMLPKYQFEDIDIAKRDIFRDANCGSSLKQRLIQAFWFANIVSGLFIASWTNNHTEEVWGLRFLDAHTPAPYSGQRVWFSLGAFQIVAACTQLQCLKDFFTLPIPLYLGNISYALYLMHNFCLSILEPMFIPLLNRVFGRTTFWGRHLNWAGGLVLYVPVIIFVADLFWRVVDTPTVRFARWLEGKCTVEKKE